MPLSFAEIAPAHAPLDLLLLADPSETKVRAYLAASRCFAAVDDGAVVAACAVQPRGAGTHELMSIAVRPGSQKSGIGTALLEWIVDLYEKAGAARLEVGTGSFGYQLAFYQRQGFRVTAIDRDFFTRNYPEPIVEEGIQLRDMLRLTREFGPQDRY